eukprot:TRINITY_DN3362_c0_g1_i12.p1 TRINITY_DN3362_c0_g1~~TRINITY_DN3362_c0_g1_i12.p1  ORF type:complete len:333 (-),score=40.40 TRINITY_DN3362_c0_g1_i12:22-1020(-)
MAGKPKYHKLVTISYNGQSAKFKITSESKSADIQDTVRSRFNIADKERLILVDDQDKADVIIDGLLETGSYTLSVSKSKEGGCCPPGSLPATESPSTYVPKGKTEKIGETDFYVVGKKEEKQSGIILVSDIFGSNSARHKQVADEFALSGWLVLMPDFFVKDHWTEQKDWAKLGEWITQKQYQWPQISKVLESAFAYFAKAGVSKIGIAGVCWGSWAVLRASATGKVHAGVSFHPSHPKLGPMLGEDQSKLLGAVTCPQLVCPAGNDDPSVKEGGLDHKILSGKPFGSQCVWKEFPEMAHGFVTRGDVSDPKVARDVRAAMDLASSFFKKHL